jgi:hypothetical protein
MEDKTSSTGLSAEQTSAEQEQQTAPAQGAGPAPSPEIAGTEHRRAYGTAKTENLRDSGLWRFLLPAVVVLCCLALLAIPLIILVWLLSYALSPTNPIGPSGVNLLWVWVVMIVIILGADAIIIRGLVKVFMTQAVNYR